MPIVELKRFITNSSSIHNVLFSFTDTGVNEDNASLEAGKDFALIRTGSGKVSQHSTLSVILKKCTRNRGWFGWYTIITEGAWLKGVLKIQSVMIAAIVQGREYHGWLQTFNPYWSETDKFLKT